MTKKNILLILLCTSNTLVSFAQTAVYNWEEISMEGIRSIQEWKITYDTTGQALDSIMEYEYFYSDKGDLLEKRDNFNTDYSKFISTTFEYNEKHYVVDRKEHNPYVVMSALYVPSAVSRCETLDRDGHPINETVTFKDGDIEFSTFTYVNGFLHKKTVYLNGKLHAIMDIRYKRE